MRKLTYSILMITAMIFFLSPLYIIYDTGNWWFMFLFFASWIPAVPVLAIVWGFNRELKEEYREELRKRQNYMMN